MVAPMQIVREEGNEVLIRRTGQQKKYIFFTFSEPGLMTHSAVVEKDTAL
jgi:hypothetical protein